MGGFMSIFGGCIRYPFFVYLGFTSVGSVVNNPSHYTLHHCFFTTAKQCPEFIESGGQLPQGQAVKPWEIPIG